MTMNDDSRFILEQALRAPSGDNTQPCHWVVRGNILELWNKSSNDPLHALYGSSPENSQALYVSFGMAIENVSVAATTRGYRTAVSYFPDQGRPTLIAVLTLEHDATIAPDPLANALKKRMTNRKMYRASPLTSDERAKLLAAGTDRESGETKLLDDRQSVKELARIASLHDELIFSIKGLHEYVFNHINWTKREDDRRRIGFYFPTLAAPPFTWGFMQLMRHWWIMRIGITFGLHKFISLEQRFVYRHSGAYGIVTAHGTAPTDWVRVGRLTERLWLAATNEGLSFHPLNGVLLLTLGIDTDEGQQMFSSEQQRRLKDASGAIARIFDVHGATIAFMFRIGHGKLPSARTSRLPFEKMVDIVPPTGPSQSDER